MRWHVCAVLYMAPCFQAGLDCGARGGAGAGEAGDGAGGVRPHGGEHRCADNVVAAEDVQRERPGVELGVGGGAKEPARIVLKPHAT